MFSEFYKKDAHYSRYYALFMVGFGTGLRIGELLALTWDDIDFSNKVIHIRKTIVYLPMDGGMKFKVQTPKTRKSVRDIPLLENIEKILRRQFMGQKKKIMRMGDRWTPLEEEGFSNLIFTTEYGTPIDRNMITRTLHQIINKMNQSGISIEQFSPHAMRHSFATRCFERGVPAKVVQEVLGYSSLNMTMDLYTHVINDTKQNEMEKINCIFKAE